jgi:hypothetical protein
MMNRMKGMPMDWIVVVQDALPLRNFVERVNKFWIIKTVANSSISFAIACHGEFLFLRVRYCEGTV